MKAFVKVDHLELVQVDSMFKVYEKNAQNTLLSSELMVYVEYSTSVEYSKGPQNFFWTKKKLKSHQIFFC